MSVYNPNALATVITHRTCQNCGVLIRTASGRLLCLHCAQVGLAAERRRTPPDFDRIGHFRAQVKLFPGGMPV